MTGQEHISSLVSDLVTMAEATRRLPEVERELREARAAAQGDGETIARLEIRLQQRNAEIDELRSRIRSLEVERDDASFRELEAQDKVNALVGVIDSTLSTLGQSLGVVKGDDKIEIMRLTVAEKVEYFDWIDAKREAAREALGRPTEPSSSPVLNEPPVQQSTGSSGSPVDDGNPSEASESTGTPSAEGVSVSSDPTNDASAAPSDGLSIASDTTAKSQDGAPNVGKYSGQRYENWPYYVSLEGWLAGGGSEADYHYRSPRS